jgi:hypothetical protein
MLESFFSTPQLKCQGTFIEMGALDGSQLSNSWFFEEVLDWRGIMVEANPKLAASAIANRPLAAVWSGAVCPAGTKSVTFMGQDGVATGAVKGMSDPLHIKNHHLNRAPSYEVKVSRLQVQ